MSALAPRVEPAVKEARAERVAGAGRVGRLDRRGGDLEAERPLAVAGEDRGPLATALDDDDRREVEQRLVLLRAEERPRLVLRREQEVRRRVLEQAQRGAAALREERGRRARRRRVTSAPASCASRVAAMPGEPERLVEQRVRREVDGVGAGEPLGLEVLGTEPERRAAVLDERALAARLHERRRSGPSARRRPGRLGTWTPSPLTAATSDRPIASRPIAHTRLLRAPRRPSQRAVVVALPPWRRRTRPGTSVPRSSGRSGARTTSMTRSPSTTIAGAAARRRARCAAARRVGEIRRGAGSAGIERSLAVRACRIAAARRVAWRRHLRDRRARATPSAAGSAARSARR